VQCAAIKRDGVHCRGIATTGSDRCPAHDPARQEARKRAASKAARARTGTGELSDLKDRLAKLYQDVLERRVDKGIGAVAAQIANAQIRLVDVELRRRYEKENIYTTEQLAEEAREIMEVVAENVDDPDALERIANDLTARIVARRPDLAEKLAP
jgi:hypothetical protein